MNIISFLTDHFNLISDLLKTVEDISNIEKSSFEQKILALIKHII